MNSEHEVKIAYNKWDNQFYAMALYIAIAEMMNPYVITSNTDYGGPEPPLRWNYRINHWSKKKM